MELHTANCSNMSFNDHILKSEHKAGVWIPTTTPLPYYIYNDTHYLLNTTRAAPSDPLTQLYSITYMYYAFIGTFITILFGWTVSYFTSSASDRYDEELVHPIARKIANYFPGKKRVYSHKEKVMEEKCEKLGCCSPSDNGSSGSAPACKKGAINPSFTHESSDEAVDGVFNTRL